MKPHLDIQQEGNLGTDNVTAMTFHAPSTGFLMSILTDLYTDPEAAVIREYAANAWDSHVEAGNPDPIMIYLPTSLRPVFTVKDHGTGMSRDTIENIYSKYGASTKRHDDTAIGMLGLGCKCALAYASQFTLISTQNGIKCVVLISRKDDGTGTVQIVDESFTSDPDGVEVQIPVTDSFSLVNKARNHFRYWNPGTVLINDAPAESIWADPDGTFIDPDVLLVKFPSDDLIVMGNIAYPIPETLKPSNDRHGNRFSKSSVVARVPIGVVDFTPSRDGLQVTARTREVVSDLYAYVRDHVMRQAQAEVDAAPNHTAAVIVANKWINAYYGMQGLTYKYSKIPNEIKTGKDDYYELVTQLNDDGSPKLRRDGKPQKNQQHVTTTADEKNEVYEWNTSRTGAAQSRNRFNLVDLVNMNALHVVGYPRMGMRLEAKEKIRLYLEQQASLTSRQRVLCYKRPFGGPWLEGVTRVEWEVIKQIKLPNTSVARKRTADWRVQLPNQHSEREVEELNPEKGVVWLPADLRWETEQKRQLAELVGDEIQLVILPLNRAAKLQRERPDATEAKVFMEILVKNTAAKITPEIAYKFCHDTAEVFMNLPTKEILDFELRTFIENIKCIQVDVNRVNNIRNRATSLGFPAVCLTYASLKVIAAPVWKRALAIFRRYPILACDPHGHGFYDPGPKEALEYVNAMFIARECALLPG